MTKEQIHDFLDALAELINDWNDLAVSEDRGRYNDALCLLIFEDGSGKIGTVSYSDRVEMNQQGRFNNLEEFTEYFVQWLR